MKIKVIYLILICIIFLHSCDSLISIDKKSGANNLDKLKTSSEVIKNNSDTSIISLDQKFASIAAGVPGFGGIFFDEKGNLNIYQKNPNSITKKNSALALLTGMSSADKTNVKILEAKYDYFELQEWRTLLRRKILGKKSVISLDINERKNRVDVGISDSLKINEVKKAITGYNIPSAAFSVVKTEPFITQQFIPPGPQGNSLAEEVDKKAGGLQIERSNGGTCTLGFNVVWYNNQTGNNEKGFVTNSHCTNTQGGTENTDFGQHTNSSSNFVGTEVEDPTYFSGTSGYYTCPTGYECRVSDTALINYTSGIDDPLGKIYKTHYYGTGSSSGSIIHDGEMFSITSEGTYPYAGQTLNKIGYRSGWTRGNISNTCEDAVTTKNDGTPIILLCQGIVNANSRPGDSGSPVFMEVSGEDNIRLEGILWGGRTLNGVRQFAFSPFASITQDLNIISVF